MKGRNATRKAWLLYLVAFASSFCADRPSDSPTDDDASSCHDRFRAVIEECNRLDEDDFIAVATDPMQVDQHLIQATPRLLSDVEAEAITITGAIVDNGEMYCRLTRDAYEIEKNYPAVACTTFAHRLGTYTVMLTVSNDVLPRMKDGSYADWLALNEKYEVESVGVYDSIRAVFLTFPGVYHSEVLADAYQLLPGVEAAGGTLNVPIGEGRQACARRGDDGAMLYLYDSGEDEHEADHVFHVFRSDGGSGSQLVSRFQGPRTWENNPLQWWYQEGCY